MQLELQLLEKVLLLNLCMLTHQDVKTSTEVMRSDKDEVARNVERLESGMSMD